MDFTIGVFNSLRVLSEFVQDMWFVPVGVREVQSRARWMREDLGSRPYHWLKADYVLVSTYLVLRDKDTKTSQMFGGASSY